jgi:hypothetical protein
MNYRDFTVIFRRDEWDDPQHHLPVKTAFIIICRNRKTLRLPLQSPLHGAPTRTPVYISLEFGASGSAMNCSSRSALIV